jgi:hypothetical protein
MSEKMIAMPNDDELFTAFNIGLQQWTPENKRAIVKQFEPFLAKAKGDVKHVVTLTDKWLECSFSKATWDMLLKWFIDSQWFLLKIPLNAVLIIFGADTFTHFVEATKAGKNNPVTTIGGLTAILTVFMQQLGEKYAVLDTPDSIKAKVELAFA